ncbi:hypothetical protein GCM10022251_81000 [Phytohabitans flavus]|uniref:Methyltransferase domain-containing protein n=1 Tax=Phytohabitans flavus TaxID=1076124 RepID=A0A6F8XL68_9ACTN|nr:hypothetical protein Pflav_009700 [Phytohabitans flavus]
MPSDTRSGAGVDQVLDLGCGLLSTGSVHEALLDVAPAVRSVHVDLDVVAVERAQTVITASGRNAVAAAVRGDLRQPRPLLQQASGRLDLARPLAIFVVGALAHLTDDEAARLLAALRQATAPGSVVVVTHASADVHPQAAALQPTVGAQPRSRRMLRSLLTGFDLVEPGITWATDWHPDPPDRPEPEPINLHASRYLLAAVARQRVGQ